MSDWYINMIQGVVPIGPNDNVSRIAKLIRVDICE